MKKYLYLFWVGLLMLTCTLTSCKTEQEKIMAEVTSLADVVEASGENFSEADWEAVLEELDAYEELADQYALSAAQKEEFGRQEGRIAAVYAKSSLSGSFSKVKGFFKGLINSFGEDEQ